MTVKYNFTQVDNEVLDVYGPQIGLNGYAVYCALARFAQSSGECWPSQETLAQMLGTTRKTIRAALAKLQAAGLIKQVHRFTEGGQTSNGYFLLPVHKQPHAAPEGVTPVTKPAEWRARWQDVLDAGGEIRMTPKTMPERPPHVPHYQRRGCAEWEVQSWAAETRQRNHDYLAALFTDAEELDAAEQAAD